MATSLSSGATTLTFATLPSGVNINVGWGLKSYFSPSGIGASRCINQIAGANAGYPSTNAVSIAAYNKVAKTITLNSTYAQVGSGGCSGGGSPNRFTSYDNGHSDALFWSSNGSSFNNAFIDNFLCTYCYSEGFFTQQTGKQNFVIRNSTMNTMALDGGGDGALLLQAATNQNLLFRGAVQHRRNSTDRRVLYGGPQRVELPGRDCRYLFRQWDLSVWDAHFQLYHNQQCDRRVCNRGKLLTAAVEGVRPGDRNRSLPNRKRMLIFSSAIEDE